MSEATLTDKRTCACPSVDARRCMDLRYRKGRGGFVCDLDGIDEECECCCHDDNEFEDDYDDCI